MKAIKFLISFKSYKIYASHFDIFIIIRNWRFVNDVDPLSDCFAYNTTLE